MTKFHYIPVKIDPHKSLKVSKGVLWSKELSLCPIEEIKRELKKQRVTDIKRVSIKRGGMINTNTYIMAFNTPKIPEKIKVGYTLERVEQYVPNPLRYYKYQKYGHHKENCKGPDVCGKCGQQDPDHPIDDCELPNKCADRGGDHPVYTKILRQLETREGNSSNQIKTTFFIMKHGRW